MKEYLIPIGLDFKGKEGLVDTISTLEELKSKGGEVGRSLDEGLSKGVKASDQLEKELKSNSDNLKEIREMAKLAGKGFAESFKSGDIKKMEKELAKFRKTAENLTANVELNIDEKKLEIFQRQIDGAESELDELRVALVMFKNVLDSLDPNSTEFKELSDFVNYTEIAFEEFDQQMAENLQTQGAYKGSLVDLNATFEEVYTDLKPMTTRLGELEDRLYEMALAGQKGTKEFDLLEKEAIKLRRTIIEVDASVDNFAKSSAKLDALIEGATGLVGAFTAVQGATALFGDESEELQEALLKVNGAMAVLQGLQAVTASLSKESAFNTVFLTKAKTAYNSTIKTTASLLGIEATATTGATLATKAFSFALKAIGIGLVITAIALLVEHWDDLKRSVNSFLPAGKDVGKTFDTIKTYALGVGNAILQYVITPFKAMTTLLTSGDVDKAIQQIKDGYNVVDNFNEGRRKQEIANNRKYQLEKEKQNIEYAKRDLERRRNRGEDVFQQEQNLLKRERRLLQEHGEKTDDLKKQIEDNEDKRFAEDQRKSEQRAQKAEQLRQKRAEEAEQRRQKEAERRAEFKRQSEEQLKQLEEELEEVRIRNIEDRIERERAELKKGLDDRIEALQKEKALTEEAENKKTELLLELEKERAEKLKEFDEKAEAERIESEVEKRKAILETKEESLEKELELIEQNFKAEREAIKQNHKDDVEFQKELIKAKEEEIHKAKKEIKLKYAKETLAEEEEIALLNIELAEKYAVKSKDTELQKQVAIQEIKLEYAQKNLSALLEAGYAENDVEVLRAQNIVNDMSDALSSAIEANNNKPFDLLEFLGIGEGLTSEEKSKMVEGFKAIYENLSAITDFVVEQYESQIEAKRESIEQLDSEIDEMESRLEKEKELREEGLANEADSLEEAINIKKGKREEEVKQAEELLKRKKQVQKAQMAVDTAVQLVNMVTASTEIFKSFSKLPFGIGIPLAIGVIGSMFGAFTVAKVKAYKAIEDQKATKYRKGGRIGGKGHNEGGTKFISETGERIELEEDEFVLRREVYKKYPRFVKAFNEGDFSKMATSDIELVNLFNEIGGFETDISSAKAVGTTFEKSKDDQTLKSIDKGIKDLNNKEEVTETESYTIIKKRNSIRRIKKK